MTWTIHDHGFEMTLSKQVPQLIGKYLRPWLSAWLQQQGVNITSRTSAPGRSIPAARASWPPSRRP
jgi:predicted naringenin-chalcone synthase